MSLFDVKFTGTRGSVGGHVRAGATTSGRALSTTVSADARFAQPLQRRGAGVAAFLLAIVTAGALAHVAVRLKGLEVAYDLGRERRIASELEEQRRRLQIEVGMLKDPRRVIAIAREKLNMGPPSPEAIWRLGSAATSPLARIDLTVSTGTASRATRATQATQPTRAARGDGR